jgi:hypothetical protein
MTEEICLRKIELSLSMPPMSTNFQNKNKKKQQHQKQNKKKKQFPKGRVSKPKHANRKGGSRAYGPRNQGVAGPRLGADSMEVATNVPMPNRSMPLVEDEYIGPINGSVGFATTAYSINPGQATVFPWGNRIAKLYQEYDFDWIEFYVTSSVSGYATQGQTGVCVLSFDYDAADNAPTTMQQVEATNPHTLPALPSVREIRLRLDAKCMRQSDAKFVRPGAQPASTDIKTYDVGQLYVSTEGNQNTTAFGRLHVRYQCRLKKQALLEPVGTGGVLHFQGITPTTANNYATTTLTAGGTPSLASAITIGPNTMTFAAGVPGNYLVVTSIEGSTSVVAGTFTPSAGAAALNYFPYGNVRDANGSMQSTNGGANTAFMNVSAYSVATTGGLVTLTPGAIVGGTAVDIWVISLPTSILATPALSPFENELNARLRRMERAMAFIRSEPERSASFSDEDDPPESGVVRLNTSTSTSSPPVQGLSSSMLEVIGEYVARKSSSNK